jgi:type I restriction enzyme R subunit
MKAQCPSLKITALFDPHIEDSANPVDAAFKTEGLVEKLVELMNANTNEANLDEYGRFAALKETIDKPKAKAYFEALEGKTIPAFKVNIKADTLLRKFILEGGFPQARRSPRSVRC